MYYAQWAQHYLLKGPMCKVQKQLWQCWAAGSSFWARPGHNESQVLLCYFGSADYRAINTRFPRELCDFAYLQPDNVECADGEKCVRRLAERYEFVKTDRAVAQWRFSLPSLARVQEEPVFLGLIQTYAQIFMTCACSISNRSQFASHRHDGERWEGLLQIGSTGDQAALNDDRRALGSIDARCCRKGSHAATLNRWLSTGTICCYCCPQDEPPLNMNTLTTLSRSWA